MAKPIDLTNHEDLLGKLVFVSGTVVKKTSTKLYLSNFGEDFVIYLRKDNGLSTKEFSAGDFVSIYGILQVYKDELRLIPRFLADIYYERAMTKVVKKNKAPFVKVAHAKNLSSFKSSKMLENTSENDYNYPITSIAVIFTIIIAQLALISALCKKQST